MAATTKGFQFLEKWLNILGAAVLTVMMLMVTANVMSRYLFQSPIEVTLELTEFFMVAIIYMGLSYTQFIKAHINIELVLSRLSDKKRTICYLVNYLVCFLFFALILWQGTLMFLEAYEMEEVTMGTIELPVAPSKLLVPVGSLIICVRFLLDIVESAKKIKGIEN